MNQAHEYNALLTETNDNFSKMMTKIYTRENIPMAAEVKETYFQNSS